MRVGGRGCAIRNSQFAGVNDTVDVDTSRIGRFVTLGRVTRTS
jgi:hypothetical protein